MIANGKPVFAAEKLSRLADLTDKTALTDDYAKTEGSKKETPETSHASDSRDI